MSASAAATSTDTPLVLIVDDDEGIREALTDLLRSVGIEAKSFGSTRELLDATPSDRPGCLILDVRLPGLSGLDLQAQLARSGNTRPIIFMTGHGDIPMSVRAMKAGALDFLTKPFRDQDMLDAVATAIDKDMAQRRDAAAAKQVAALAATLTPREAEVMAAVVKGLMNKQIAGLLGISEITVKLHRGNVMRKMGVRSVADLVRKSELLER
ncbi:MAG: response regulator transcription factor [Inquilinus limosus]|uniref:Response regulator transcription factor n=1 Tax=Inquilinus limosus TaxID=171674 RepID=A0A952FHW3_9PROT|nr:response regulator transcription factor [Inquilinus limosus]